MNTGDSAAAGIMTGDAYRYPGSRPFYDTEVDRRLFFGRDREKDALLYKVLADNLVVLYAKSGLGKTSLINAGLNQALREKGYLPLMIRFNDPGTDPLQAFYSGIKEIAGRERLDYEPGEEETLWQYFKTAAFWSPDDTRLKPVLILDQFEEFFMLHSPESRKQFTRQLADVVNDKVPEELRESLKPGESFPYSDKPLNVKVIISLREDYLGQLEEMSRDIPDILVNRFRLLPLSREQARLAIVEPSQIKDELIHAASFEFAQGTVDMMLDFLCKRRERTEIKMTDEVESFQLQLLCRDIEGKVREILREGSKNKEARSHLPNSFPLELELLDQSSIDENINQPVVINENDLGGEAGMKGVLEQFYDDQIKKLAVLREKRQTRKLCEKGLISGEDRRISLEEGEIKRKFGLTEALLAELVNSRLLRSEPRVGSIYYELSHDTLVPPIRESQKKRSSRRLKVRSGIVFICLLVITAFFIKFPNQSPIHSKTIDPDKKKDPAYYNNVGNTLLEKQEYKNAIGYYKIAVDNAPEYIDAYNNMGKALNGLEEYDEAIDVLEKAIELSPKYINAYNNKGKALKGLRKYAEAIGVLKKALIELDSEYADVYLNMGDALSGQQKYPQAIEAYKKAIELDPKKAEVYNNMGIAFDKQAKYILAIEAYKKAFEIAPEYNTAKANLALLYITTKSFDKAFKLSTESIKEKNTAAGHVLAMRFISISSLLFQGKQQESITQLRALIKYYQSLIKDYKRTWSYKKIKDFIKSNKQLPPGQTNLLLQLIDLLESTKKEGDKKIKEIEKAMDKVFK